MTETIESSEAYLPVLKEDIAKLPSPLNKIIIEQIKGEHRDFGLDPDDPYPMHEVTYPTYYGYLPNHLGEDNAELDFLVGTDLKNGKVGFITVNRGSDIGDEHKFFIGANDEEVENITTTYEPVLTGIKHFDTLDELLNELEKFKKEN